MNSKINYQLDDKVLIHMDSRQEVKSGPLTFLTAGDQVANKLSSWAK